jgi:hypothetical protein|nr:MAG TPA: NinB protein [Caudoviricetes sp.]
MKFTGRLKEPVIDYKTGRLMVLFEPQEDFRQAYEEFKECEKLSLEIKKYRRKRSLDANAYAWVLMSKLAEVLHTSKEEVYEEMLRRYGTLYEDGEGYITITLKSSIPIEKLEGHWLCIRKGDSYTGYAMIKGSSEYDTGEMSRFIDGVISECKELGIQTMTPDEIEELKQKWGVEVA